MSDDRYGNTRVAKIRAAYNDLRSALAEGDMGAAQAAFARYEQWSDYILDKRHSDRISALEARVKALFKRSRSALVYQSAEITRLRAEVERLTAELAEARRAVGEPE